MNVLINKNPRRNTSMHVFEKYYVIIFGWQMRSGLRPRFYLQSILVCVDWCATIAIEVMQARVSVRMYLLMGTGPQAPRCENDQVNTPAVGIPRFFGRWHLTVWIDV